MREDLSDVFENLERDTMGASWRTPLEAEFTKPYFRKVRVEWRLLPLALIESRPPAQGFLDSREQIASNIPTGCVTSPHCPRAYQPILFV